MAKTSKQDQKSSSLMGRLLRFIQVLGPGLITGASDDDPSGIGTYSQAGAQLGFGIGWTMLLTYPLMVAIQEISARIGRTTGHGIAGNLCRVLLQQRCNTVAEHPFTAAQGGGARNERRLRAPFGPPLAGRCPLQRRP
jgi:Mn2+/Fe2+ NRAMP family transporter